MLRYASWKRLTGDGIAVEGACLLESVSGNGTAAGSIATLYAAQYADGTQKILTLKAPANETQQVSFDPPIPCDNGLYVDFDSNGVEVLVSFIRIHTNPDLWERTPPEE